MTDRTRKIRRPVVAGQFYPGDPASLESTIAAFFAPLPEPDPDVRPLAVVSPHAGYVYSGPTAAVAFNSIRGKKFSRVVVISPSHVVAFDGVSLFDGDAYSTPLGEIAIDGELSQELADKSEAVGISGVGHETAGQRGEHALEILLPFLQYCQKDFKLAAAVIGDQDIGTCESFGKALAQSLDPDSDLIVASTDLSHFYPAQEAEQLDARFIKAFTSGDPHKVAGGLTRREFYACGGWPVVAAMIAGGLLGATRFESLQYTHSGKTSGYDREVVGYMAGIIY